MCVRVCSEPTSGPSPQAEMAPAAWRGTVVSVYEEMLAFGMLISQLVDLALGEEWRFMVSELHSAPLCLQRLGFAALAALVS